VGNIQCDNVWLAIAVDMSWRGHMDLSLITQSKKIFDQELVYIYKYYWYINLASLQSIYDGQLILDYDLCMVFDPYFVMAI
jgi:hypothetical protein